MLKRCSNAISKHKNTINVYKNIWPENLQTNKPGLNMNMNMNLGVCCYDTFTLDIFMARPEYHTCLEWLHEKNVFEMGIPNFKDDFCVPFYAQPCCSPLLLCNSFRKAPAAVPLINQHIFGMVMMLFS